MIKGIAIGTSEEKLLMEQILRHPGVMTIRANSIKKNNIINYYN